MGFTSAFKKVGPINLPEFSGLRVMMLPVVLNDLGTVPDMLDGYRDTLAGLFGMCPSHAGKVGYITIDEKRVGPSATHRRAGKHVDGIYQGRNGSWGGGGGSWGSAGSGMLTVSNPAGCRAWDQEFDGWPGYEGECDHLSDQCRDDRATLFEPGVVYWVDGMCVHESVPMVRETNRQFVRLSMPSDGPWFEGYTENPLGVKPTGPILPRRRFMD